ASGSGGTSSGCGTDAASEGRLAAAAGAGDVASACCAGVDAGAGGPGSPDPNASQRIVPTAARTTSAASDVHAVLGACTGSIQRLEGKSKGGSADQVLGPPADQP